MPVKKIKFCDNDLCGKMIDPAKNRYLHFPYYGWNGKIFCTDTCLKDWAVRVSEMRGANMPEIQIN